MNVISRFKIAVSPPLIETVTSLWVHHFRRLVGCLIGLSFPKMAGTSFIHTPCISWNFIWHRIPTRRLCSNPKSHKRRKTRKTTCPAPPRPAFWSRRGWRPRRRRRGGPHLQGLPAPPRLLPVAGRPDLIPPSQPWHQGTKNVFNIYLSVILICNA